MGNVAAWKAAEKRRQTFLEAMAEPGATVDTAAEAAGVKSATYHQWRIRYPKFASQVDAVRTDWHQPGDAPIETGTKWEGGFAPFRYEFFGHSSPWFQLRIVDVLEKAIPGEITLITIPPEHGKTSTLEDWCSMMLALDPTFRITVGSEKQQHSRKILRRVKGRMEDGGPFPLYRKRFGPFRAPKGNPKRTEQPWAADFFDVFKRGTFDERDYSMSGIGMTSAVAGTRTDFLLVDDPQSRKSLNLTDEMVAIFRQDWLSRPGSKGKTVVLMTRQGELDFAEALVNAGIVDHHIVLPAINAAGEWLWPERYSPEEYGIMRRNVGEEAWERNYLQITRPSSSIIFTRDTIEKGRDELRQVDAGFPTDTAIDLAIDPGFNVMGFAAGIIGAEKLQLLTARKFRSVRGTEGIFDILEDHCHRYSLAGGRIHRVIIESKAFQKGLLTDERLLALQRVYGFRIEGHETGNEKHDPELGIPQIVNALNQHALSWPYADDGVTREILRDVEDDMYRWRPGIKGNKLEQDALMAVWFLFLRWKRERRVIGGDPSQFDFGGANRLWLPGQRGVA